MLMGCQQCPQKKGKLLYGNFMVCPFCGFLLTNVWFPGLHVFFFFQFQLLNASDCKFLAAVIYPSLTQLEGEFIELEDSTLGSQSKEILARKRVEGRRKLSDNDLERDEECGICMENCTRMVLPSCGHALCNRCFHDW
jgi:hypothetical protein